MLIHCSLVLWAVIQFLIPGSETNPDDALCTSLIKDQCKEAYVRGRCPTACQDNSLCENLSVEKCKKANIRTMCRNLCTDDPLCPSINIHTCKDTAVRKRCPQTCIVECLEADGFFNVPGSGNQCFKFFPGSRQRWDLSKSLCHSKDLQLAKIDDPATAVAVRKYIVETYGKGKYTTNDHWTWVGAKGTSSSEGTGTVNWFRDATTIDRGSSAWSQNNPSIKTSTKWCLLLNTDESNIGDFQPYYMEPCLKEVFALCELIK